MPMNSISDLISDLKSRSIKTRPKYNPKQHVSAWLEDDVLGVNEPVVKSLVLILRTHGCSWHRSTAKVGGCTMCGYVNDCLNTETPIKPEDIIYQFQSAVERFTDKPFKLVKIFTSGSFLDDNEVPQNVQRTILKMCNDLDMQSVTFESRPEFVTTEKIEELTAIFPKGLQIAIGLESANSDVLKYSINKGFQFQDYCDAVKIAKEFDISIKTYLLLKPLFLTEREAIEDVLHSIQKLREHDLTNCISINPVNIQKFTIVEYAYRHRDYRPPWLWSVIDVLRRGHAELTGTRIRLLSQPTGGGSLRGPHNCGKCDERVLEAIAEFSLNNNPEIFKNLSCTCQDIWKDILDLEIIAKSTLEPIFEFSK